MKRIEGIEVVLICASAAFFLLLAVLVLVR